MDKTYRLKPGVKYLGMALTGLFLMAVLIYVSLFFIDDPAQQGFRGENSVLIVGGFGLLVFGSAMVLSLYIWVAYYIENLTINGTRVRVRSMFQDHEFDTLDLQSLTWRVRPAGGRILFRTEEGKSYLDLYGFALSDRLRMIEAIRDLVPDSTQEGWPEFCHKLALPLRDGRPSQASTDPSVKYVQVTRWRYDRVALLTLPPLVIVATGLGIWDNLWHFAALPVLGVAAWLTLRLSVPREGRLEVRLNSTSAGRGMLVGWITVIGALVVMAGVSFLGFDRTITCWTGCLILGGGLVPVVYQLHQTEKQQQSAEAHAAKSAPELWSRKQVHSAESSGSEFSQ